MSTYEPGYFSGLQNDLHIHESVFTQVSGDVNYYNISTDLYNHESEQGLHTLSKAIAAGALHDASERSPPPKCHPETRKRVLEIIMAWIEDLDFLRHILWLYGPIGSGKSAIMQTIAELCRSSNKGLGGTFFFSRGKPGREDGHLLFATIAYQLALHVPGLRQHVNRAMSIDPTLDTKDLSEQLKALIIEPFQRLSPPPSKIYFVIIDGLDECQGHETQKQILTLIAKNLASANIPLRFLITSRPEPHIREVFSQPHLDHRTRRIPLDSSFNPDRDIRLFLKDGFDAIAKRNQDAMSKMEIPWPTKSDIDSLVEKSSGQFIYPATVLKFVGAELHNPIRQLDIVLKPAPLSSASALYSNIDLLYTQILDTCPYPEILAPILSLLLVLHCSQPPEVYAEILGVSLVDVTFTLRGLHSLVRFPNPEEDKREKREFNLRNEYDQTRGLRLHHASFRDFLLDEHRCPKQFVVDLETAHAQLAESGFKLTMHWISSPWRAKTDSNPPHRETWGYLKHHMSNHLDQCRSSDRSAIMEDLNRFCVVFPAKAPREEKIWDHAFDAIHSLVTILAMVVSSDGSMPKHNDQHRSNFQSEHSHWAQEFTLDTVSLSGSHCDLSETLDLHNKYRGMLDDFYKSALSSSSEMLLLLNKLPGFVTQTKPVPFDSLEALFGVDIEEISTTIMKNQSFIRRWDTGFWTRYYSAGQDSTNVVLLNPHFSGFLCDPDRAGQFYLDPDTRRLLDLRHIISLIFRSDWLKVPRQRKALVHLDEILRSCLDSATIDPLKDYPNDHPILGLMDVLKHIVYDIPCLEVAPVLNVQLIWSATRRLLDWIYGQNAQISKAKDERHGFRTRLIHISNRIYHQLLEVETSECGQRTITVRKPFLVALPSSPVSLELESPPSSRLSNSDTIRVSETILALHGLRASLLSFLTKPERAGELYISVEIYHSQLAEMCLDYCDSSVANIIEDWKTLPAHTEWRFHLVRAIPSTKILTRLRSLRQGPWLAGGLPSIDSEAKVKSIKAIIDWLAQMPKLPADIHQRWQEELVIFERFKRSKTVRFRHRTISDNSP